MYEQYLELPWEALLGEIRAVPESIYFAACLER